MCINVNNIRIYIYATFLYIFKYILFLSIYLAFPYMFFFLCFCSSFVESQIAPLHISQQTNWGKHLETS